MPVLVNLKPLDRKKPDAGGKPKELGNVAVDERKTPWPAPPPKVVRTLSDVKVPGRHRT